MKSKYLKLLSTLILFILSTTIFLISGCKTKPQPAKYGGPPATKYGIQPTTYETIDIKQPKDTSQFIEPPATKYGARPAYYEKIDVIETKDTSNIKL